MSNSSALEIYTLVKDILAASAALGAVLIAKEGLDTWRRQLKGSTEYEHSRRLLRAIYKWRDAVGVVRNPVMWPTELSQLPEGFSSTPDVERHVAVSFAYERRWKVLSDARSELEAELLESEILWGKEVKESCKKLFELQVELLVNLEVSMRTRDPRLSEEDRKAESAVLKAMRRVLYERSPKDDPFAQDLQSAIEKLEAIIQPHLKR